MHRSATTPRLSVRVNPRPRGYPVNPRSGSSSSSSGSNSSSRACLGEVYQQNEEEEGVTVEGGGRSVAEEPVHVRSGECVKAVHDSYYSGLVHGIRLTMATSP